MSSAPSFMGSPLLRALLRTLAFAAVIEAIFHRLLTIPGRSEAWPWLADLHASTGRAGDLMAGIAFALLLPTLLGVGWAALRAPAWPGAVNPLSSMGILVLLALLAGASVTPRGPTFAFAFAGVSLLVGLGMLAGMFETRDDLPGRCFAVALAGALTCSTLAFGLEWTRSLPLPAAPDALREAAAAGGRWLLFAAGVLAFPSFAPPPSPLASLGGRAAALGVSAATAFTLVAGAVAQAPVLARLTAALGGSSAPVSGRILTTGVAAAALFLVTFTAYRGLLNPDTRIRAYGLLFLLLAGHPYVTAYQHLLALLGLALVTASRQEAASALPAGGFNPEGTPHPNA